MQLRFTFFCDNYLLLIFIFSVYNRMLVSVLIQSLRSSCSECNDACTASKKNQRASKCYQEKLWTKFSIGLSMCNLSWQQVWILVIFRQDSFEAGRSHPTEEMEAVHAGCSREGGSARKWGKQERVRKCTARSSTGKVSNWWSYEQFSKGSLRLGVDIFDMCRKTFGCIVGLGPTLF